MVRFRVCSGRSLIHAGHAAALVIVAFWPCSTWAAPPATEDAVVLKSGKVLQGRVVGKQRIGDRPVLTVETDFGRILVPAAEVSEQRTEPAAADATFEARRIRIVELSGTVQRKARGETAWAPVRDAAYAKPDDPWPELAPGDGVRTGPDGVISFMPHKGVWVRLAADTEIEIAGKGEGATLSLLNGDVIAKVSEPPRGKTVRVRLPGAMLGVREGHVAASAGETEKVVVKDGAAKVGDATDVPAGQTAEWKGKDPAALRAATAPETEVFEAADLRLPADDLVLVPGGEYLIGGGNHRSVPAFDAPNQRERKVRLSAFLIDRTKASIGAFAAFLRATRRRASSPMLSAVPDDDLARRPAFPLTWEEASDFLRWCGKDLPTSDQWEAAARGREASTFPWGETLSSAHEAALSVAWATEEWARATAPGAPPEGRLRYLRRTPAGGEPAFDVSDGGTSGLLAPPYEWTRSWAEEIDFHPSQVPPGYDPPPKSIRIFRGASTRRAHLTGDARIGVRGVREVK